MRNNEVIVKKCNVRMNISTYNQGYFFKRYIMIAHITDLEDSQLKRFLFYEDTFFSHKIRNGEKYAAIIVMKKGKLFMKIPSRRLKIQGSYSIISIGSVGRKKNL